MGTEGDCASVGTEVSKSKTESEVCASLGTEASKTEPEVCASVGAEVSNGKTESEGKRKRIIVGTVVKHDVGRWRRGAGIGKLVGLAGRLAGCLSRTPLGKLFQINGLLNCSANS